MRVAKHDLRQMRFVLHPYSVKDNGDHRIFEVSKIDLSQVPAVSKIMITLYRVFDGEDTRYYLDFADKPPSSYDVFRGNKHSPAEILAFYGVRNFNLDNLVTEEHLIGPLGLEMAQTLVNAIINKHNEKISDVPYVHVNLDQLTFSKGTITGYESCPPLFLLDGCKLSVVKHVKTGMLAISLSDQMAREDTAATAFDRAFPEMADELKALSYDSGDTFYGHLDGHTAQSFIDFVVQENTDNHNDRARNGAPKDTYPAEYRREAPTADGSPRVITVQFGVPSPPTTL